MKNMKNYYKDKTIYGFNLPITYRYVSQIDINLHFLYLRPFKSLCRPSVRGNKER